MKLTLVLILLLTISFCYSSNQEKIEQLDSAYNVYQSLLTEKYNEIADSLKHKENCIIQDENEFWKDTSSYYFTILALLTALIPIYFFFTEFYKAKTQKKLKELNRDVDKLRYNIKAFSDYQLYLDLYFEHVVKPSIDTIVDCLSSTEEKVDYSVITDQFYDYEKAIHLFHHQEEKANSAEKYIMERKSKYILAKLERLKEEITNKDKKAKVTEIINYLIKNSV